MKTALETLANYGSFLYIDKTDMRKYIRDMADRSNRIITDNEITEILNRGYSKHHLMDRTSSEFKDALKCIGKAEDWTRGAYLSSNYRTDISWNNYSQNSLGIFMDNLLGDSFNYDAVIRNSYDYAMEMNNAMQTIDSLLTPDGKEEEIEINYPRSGAEL